MGEKLKLEVRERPDVIQSFRLLPSEAEQLKGYAESHGAKVSDVVISALKQTGVIAVRTYNQQKEKESV